MATNQKMNSPKVAIIVPIYNPGIPALSRALQSLCAQTLREIEIICVLDCPTDGSDIFVKELASTDDRIVVLKNDTNQGVSHSRNAGIAQAVLDGAEFIGFMDSDDYVDSSMFEKLYLHATTHNFDVVRCNTIIEENEHNETTFFNDPTWNGIVRSLLLPMHSPMNPNYLSRSVWNGVYRTGIVKHVQFLNHSDYNEEDTLFNLEVCSLTKNIDCIPNVLYHWVKNPDSLSNEKISHQQFCNRFLNYLEYVWHLIKEYQITSFIDAFYVTISWFLRQYRTIISTMDANYQHRLGRILTDCRFPILGRYEDLKIISKARIKLFILVIKLKKFV